LINGKKVLAIIPARGGSKRLPRKNVLDLAGKPLIGWTIEAAQKSNYIDSIVVSTDCKEIAEIAEVFGISVPELRPRELSTDTATTQDVIIHTLNKYGKCSDIVIILQPTSPLRTADHIDDAIGMFEDNRAFSIVSVTPCEHPPQWANTLPENNSMKDFVRKNELQRSQDLGEFFRLNGAIYIYDTDKFLVEGKLAYGENTFAYKMENEASIDIDTQFDFEISKFLLMRHLSSH
jgi:N-acylneuraminate cytidylyltransferase